jgi:ubiquinol-cytochrome c reductase cytochrome c subunit
MSAMPMKTIRLVLALAAVFVQAGALAASPEKGKAAFVKNGCWECHGFAGQGGAAGPKLAPDPKPLDFMQVFVRHSNGPMPPYTETILSNDDLADIHAYLESLPKAPDAKSLPLLNP